MAMSREDRERAMQMRNAVLKDLVDPAKFGRTIAKLAPRGVEPEEYGAQLKVYFAEHEYLFNCTPGSILQGMVRVAQTGLTLGVSCDLLPFKRQAVFSPRYGGLIELAYASGVRSINADVVLEGEDFVFRKGTEPRLSHVPFGENGQRDVQGGHITGAYIVAELKPGSYVFEYQSRAQLDAVRETYSQKWWKDVAGDVIPLEDIAWWARKRMVRMGSAFWPKNPRFAAALMYENTAEEVDGEFTVIDAAPADPKQLSAGGGEELAAFEARVAAMDRERVGAGEDD